MPVHLIGSGARGAFDIASTCRFDALLPVRGEAVVEGTLAGAKVPCPRKGLVDGRDCLDCVHLQTWRDKPDLVLHCAAHDGDPVGDWMRRKPPATTVETRCYAADQFAAARQVHHLLVFDRRLTLAGVICRCDLGRGGERAVAEVMSKDVFAVEPATTLGVAATAMRELHIHCLPVVSGPLVLGVLTRSDLDRAGAPDDAAR